MKTQSPPRFFTGTALSAVAAWTAAELLRGAGASRAEELAD